jgi:ADP-ribosylation factor-like protein 1
MGNTFSSTPSEPEVRLIMLGLHGCGKTTLLDRILRQWKDSLPQIHWPVHWRKGTDHEQPWLEIPQIGHYVHTISRKNVMIQSWELWQGRSVAPAWLWLYFRGCSGLVYVVKPSEATWAAEESLWMLDKLIGQIGRKDMGFARVPVLLWLTIQVKTKDKEKGMLETEEEISRILNVEQRRLDGVPIRIQGVSGVTGEGIEEGLEWIMEAIKKKEIR